ncbi:MAG TPA: hypothetical protein PLE30_08765 [Candidatus Kapabacteria bacterium]|nr:hypothetical protein [Candidatus Kapabacteria bacterium]
MNDKSINISISFKWFYIIVFNLLVCYGLLTILYLNKPFLSLIYLIPLIILSCYYAYVVIKYDLEDNRINSKRKIWDILFSAILGFLVFPTVRLLFNESIDTKTIIISIVNSIIFALMPFFTQKIIDKFKKK